MFTRHPGEREEEQVTPREATSQTCAPEDVPRAPHPASPPPTPPAGKARFSIHPSGPGSSAGWGPHVPAGLCYASGLTQLRGTSSPAGQAPGFARMSSTWPAGLLETTLPLPANTIKHATQKPPTGRLCFPEAAEVNLSSPTSSVGFTQLSPSCRLTLVFTVAPYQTYSL